MQNISKGSTLYLDFDGCLHHEAVYVSPKRGIYIDQEIAPGAVLFEWAHYLVDALAPYPKVLIVLSTSWCRRPGFNRAKARLPLELSSRVVGGTFHRRFHGADRAMEREFTLQSRADQILADVARRQPMTWLALDDDSDAWPAKYLWHLVPCNGSLGLSSPVTRAELASRLREMCEA